MSKKLIIIVGVILGVLLISGGVYAYTNNQNEKEEQEKMVMEQKTEDEAMMKKDNTTMEKEDDTMINDDAVMEKNGGYVVLADYDSNLEKYADSKKVYFFHASWCPVCQGIDKDITGDPSQIPAGVTIIKTDFDSNTELRQKYGVTTQYTFVQVDANGNETKQWSATSLEKALSEIES